MRQHARDINALERIGALPPLQLRLVRILASFDGIAWPSHGWLAKRLGTTARTIRRAFRQLAGRLGRFWRGRFAVGWRVSNAYNVIDLRARLRVAAASALAACPNAVVATVPTSTSPADIAGRSPNARREPAPPRGRGPAPADPPPPSESAASEALASLGVWPRVAAAWARLDDAAVIGYAIRAYRNRARRERIGNPTAVMAACRSGVYRGMA